MQAPGLSPRSATDLVPTINHFFKSAFDNGNGMTLRHHVIVFIFLLERSYWHITIRDRNKGMVKAD